MSDHNPQNLRGRFASNFDRGTRYKHGNVLSLVEQFWVEWVDFFRENLTFTQIWVPKLVGSKVSIWKKIISELFSISAAGRVFLWEIWKWKGVIKFLHNRVSLSDIFSSLRWTKVNLVFTTSKLTLTFKMMNYVNSEVVKKVRARLCW